jgi:hypothetical protein
MAFKGAECMPARQVPDLERAVSRCGDCVAAVCCHRDPRHRVGMAAEGADRLPGRQLPDPEGAVMSVCRSLRIWLLGSGSVGRRATKPASMLPSSAVRRSVRRACTMAACRRRIWSVPRTAIRRRASARAEGRLRRARSSARRPRWRRRAARPGSDRRPSAPAIPREPPRVVKRQARSRFVRQAFICERRRAEAAPEAAASRPCSGLDDASPSRAGENVPAIRADVERRFR